VKSNKMFSIIALVLMFGSLACSPRFACKDVIEGQGVQCESVGAVYEKEILGEGSSHGGETPKGAETKGSESQAADPGDGLLKKLSYAEDPPLRIPPKVIRIWIAPWEDSDGDLHQPEYVYSEITDKRGRWIFGEKQVSGPQPLFRPVEPSESLEEGKKKETLNEEKRDIPKTPARKMSEKTGKKADSLKLK